MYSALFHPVCILLILQRPPCRTAVNEGREWSHRLARRRAPTRAPRPNHRLAPRCTGGLVLKHLARIRLRLARDFGFGRENSIPATIYAFSCIFSNPNPPLRSRKMSTAERAAALARKTKGTAAAVTTTITGGSYHHAAAAPFPIGHGNGAAAATSQQLPRSASA